MKNLKSGLAVIMALSVLLGLSSCGKARSADYKLPDEFSTVTDEVIAQNSRYSLVWSNESKNAAPRRKSGELCLMNTFRPGKQATVFHPLCRLNTIIQTTAP